MQFNLPEQKKKNVDRSYTHPEIKTILDNCDVRMKAVVSILASTGIRRGALPMLKLSHVEDRKTSEGQKVYKFTIYENTKEQYFTFCTPEATNSIDAKFSDTVNELFAKSGPEGMNLVFQMGLI